MRKQDELTNLKSCMSRARPDEMTFVLLGRDAAAPAAIRAWVAERMRLGKNQRDDEQIVEALECADAMDAERPPTVKIESSRKATHGPVKVMVRADRPAGIVRAFIAKMDETEKWLLSTLDIEEADEDSQLFEEWHRALSGYLERKLRSFGVPVDCMQTIRKGTNPEAN